LVRHGERDAVKQLLADDLGFLRRPLMTGFAAPILLQQISRPLWAYVVARIFSAHKRINILGDAKQTARGRRASGSKLVRLLPNDGQGRFDMEAAFSDGPPKCTL
jgi:hypothetical protein